MQARTPAGVCNSYERTMAACPDRRSSMETGTDEKAGRWRERKKKREKKRSGAHVQKEQNAGRDRKCRRNRVWTRVLRIANLTETFTYLRMTGSPFCCCDMVSASSSDFCDWTVCAGPTRRRSRPGRNWRSGLERVMSCEEVRGAETNVHCGLRCAVFQEVRYVQLESVSGGGNWNWNWNWLVWSRETANERFSR